LTRLVRRSSFHASWLTRTLFVTRTSTQIKERAMTTGTVKFFNYDRGYGFISDDSGGPDAFVHVTAVEAAGLPGLNKDEKISYDLEKGNDGKSSAVNLKAA
jgi:CspA family cold shock protein